MSYKVVDLLAIHQLWERNRSTFISSALTWPLLLVYLGPLSPLQFPAGALCDYRSRYRDPRVARYVPDNQARFIPSGILSNRDCGARLTRFLFVRSRMSCQRATRVTSARASA